MLISLMSSVITRGQYLNCFNDFVDQLKKTFTNEKEQTILSNICSRIDNKKINNGLIFNNSIKDELFTDFTKSKIKVFSHKEPDTMTISESLFGKEFCLKNILNNQPDEFKKLVWFFLHSIFLLSEYLKDNINTDRVNKMKEILNISSESDTESEGEKTGSLQNMLGIHVNEDTSSMMEDIVKSFEDMLGDKNTTNPFASILSLSQKISTKYADKINSGDIELDKIFESMNTKLPGADGMVSEMMKGMGIDMKGGMMDVLKGFSDKNKENKDNEKIIIDENFSTADVPVGKLEENNSNFKIGSVLKMADKFGIIPGGKDKEENETNSMTGLGDMAGLAGLGGLVDGANIPGLDKIMQFMNKFGDMAVNEEPDPEKVKNDMNDFMSKEMGINMNEMLEKFMQPNKMNKDE